MRYIAAVLFAVLTSSCGITPEDHTAYDPQGDIERHARALLPSGTVDCSSWTGLGEGQFRIYRAWVHGQATNYDGPCLAILPGENAVRDEGTWPDGVTFGYHPVSFKSLRRETSAPYTQWVYLDGHRPNGTYEWISYTLGPSNNWPATPFWHPYATMFTLEFAAHAQW